MDEFELHSRLNTVLRQIGALERKVDFLFKHLGVTFVDERPPPNEIERFIIAGDMLSAVKLHQKTHGVNLLEAKRAIDEIKAKWGF